MLGVAVLLLLAFAVSSNRKAIRPRVVFSALAAQFAIGALVLFVPFGRRILAGAADGVDRVLEYGNKGVSFIFGGLVDKKMFDVFGDQGFVFGLRVLPMIIFVTAFIAVLYHLGVMSWIVTGLGVLFQKLLGVSRIESFSAVATIFLGQSEMPAVVKPFVRQIDRRGAVCRDVQRHGYRGGFDTGGLCGHGREIGLPAGGLVHGGAGRPVVRQDHLPERRTQPGGDSPRSI